MNASIVPASCGAALALMTSVVFSHWWSVRGFVGAVESNTLALTAPPSATPKPTPAPRPKAPSRPGIPQPVLAAATPPSQPPQREFFVSLVDEMKQLKRENSALRNQVAETNRDLMNLEFRVDTHSTQFRPLRVEDRVEDRADDSEYLTDPPIFDDGPGVLPPRPVIVALPGDE
ncbi:MAG: DivIVA domain-containing protein [Akkermansiaceae bacterium]|nr:DivIVA domain-containing protein [Akkermansiaceae bacterium]MCF7734247.1 DivIVA domain-containing protein [Akkermansiaceae bacterium]